MALKDDDRPAPPPTRWVSKQSGRPMNVRTCPRCGKSIGVAAIGSHMQIPRHRRADKPGVWCRPPLREPVTCRALLLPGHRCRGRMTAHHAGRKSWPGPHPTKPKGNRKCPWWETIPLCWRAHIEGIEVLGDVFRGWTREQIRIWEDEQIAAVQELATPTADDGLAGALLLQEGGLGRVEFGGDDAGTWRWIPSYALTYRTQPTNQPKETNHGNCSKDQRDARENEGEYQGAGLPVPDVAHRWGRAIRSEQVFREGPRGDPEKAG